jgi:hypothetical protein
MLQDIKETKEEWVRFCGFNPTAWMENYTRLDNRRLNNEGEWTFVPINFDGCSDVVCDCAKNTSTPCMVQCFECAENKK